MPLLALVVGHEVKVGDAHRDDDMNGNRVPKVRENLVAKRVLIAVRVGDDE
jgi:hypothetical protein